jgi:outer membrane protein assembly factor BamB
VKRPLVIAAAAVAVAVAGVSYWWFALRPSEDSADPPTPKPTRTEAVTVPLEESRAKDLLPDLPAAPVAGPLFDSTEIMGPGFRRTGFLPAVDPAIGFAYGVTNPTAWYQGYDEDYDRGAQDGAAYATAEAEYRECIKGAEPDSCEYPIEAEFREWAYENDGGYRAGFDQEPRATPDSAEGTMAALAAFSLDTGERIWLVNLEEEFGPAREGATPALWLLPKLDGLFCGAVYWPPQHEWSDNEAQTTLFTFDASGQIISHRTRSDAGDFLAAGDRALLVSYSAMRAEAFLPTDLNNPVWETNLWSTSFGGQILSNPGTGTVWLGATDGLVDAATGELVGALYSGEEGAGYRLANGGADLLLRQDYEDFSVTRVDPATGRDLWQKPIRFPGGNCTATPQLSGGRVMLAVYEGYEEITTVIVADAATGEVLWTQDLGRGYDWYLGATEAAAFAHNAEQVRLFSWAGGEPGAHPVRLDRPAGFGTAATLLYVLGADGEVTAFDTAQGAEAAWSLPLLDGAETPFHPSGSVEFSATDDRLFAAWDKDATSQLMRELRPS